jgi:hypothetical protein
MIRLVGANCTFVNKAAHQDVLVTRAGDSYLYEPPITNHQHERMDVQTVRFGKIQTLIVQSAHTRQVEGYRFICGLVRTNYICPYFNTCLAKH